MQVYLPDDLYQAVKRLGLPASEMLQKAIRRELVAEEKRAGIEQYIEELVAEFGEPTPEEVAEAEALAARLAGDRQRERTAS